MLCSCDGPAHPYDPGWCVSGPVPRPAGWGSARQGQNVTIIVNVNPLNNGRC